MLLIATLLAVSTLLYDGTLAQAPEATHASIVRPVFEPSPGWRPAVGDTPWVAPHVETSLWSTSRPDAETAGPAHQWTPLQVLGAADQGRFPVWDPLERHRGWISAQDVGPIDPAFLDSAYLPPIGHRLAWSGSARITMYTCVELGGCAATASGLWPEPGMVAVDPAVIPLGSKVWVQGLGTFVATDTGSLVHGAHLDVFTLSYADALDWGVQQRAVFVFERE